MIVGLGNPGREYAQTRHNAGFLSLDRLAVRRRAVWKDEARLRSRVGRAEMGGQTVILCQPQTFMNASGEAVQKVAAFYKVPPERIAIVTDDADLPLGTIRMRTRGSSGGHHGLESVEQHLGTRDYPRVRVGIGREAGGAREITGYVLARFAESERALFDLVLDRVCNQLERWVTAGAQRAMNEFNGTINPPLVKES